MPHVQIVQNGVVIVKPDPRLKRAVRVAQQFLGKLGTSIPGIRSLVRHENMLHWLHREVHKFGARPKYRGKAVYLALDEKLLTGVRDLSALVRANRAAFLPIPQLENAIRSAFGLIAKEKIRSEYRKKIKKRVQTYGEPWQHRAR